ncbi:OmpA family protein [Chelativorans sp. Marseille-P2723]|uniref:OmpA family protein n=1 Tax=Chelativorans sp. Marseille-P2723 TaxID=2709133 RepID=UPI00156F39DA|nr:OmpA family protein [Chelativorans sp. Marseille-P2723]
MTSSRHFLAGTALCLLIAAPAPAIAAQAPSDVERPRSVGLPLIVAQAELPGDDGEPGDDCPPGTATGEDGGCVVLEDAVPPPEADVPEAEDGAPEEAAPPEEPDVPEPEAESEAPAEPAPEQAPEEAAPEAEEPSPADEGEETAPPAEQAPVDVAPEAEEPPAADEPAESGEEQEVPAEAAPAEPQAEEPGEDACPPGTELSAAGECVTIDDVEEAAPAEEEAPVEEAPAEAAPEAEEPPAGQPADADEEQEVPAEAAPQETEPESEAQESPAIEDAGPEEAAPTEEPVLDDATEEAIEEGVLPENAAPVLDSQKEIISEQPSSQDAPQPEVEEEPQPQQAEEVAPPETDQEAQENLVDREQVREELRAILQEEGRRIDLGDDPELRRERRREFFQPREDARVLRRYDDDRMIIEWGDREFVRSPDYDRIIRRGDNVRYEELRGGYLREVVERRDGTRVITIRNRYGDVVRRVRVTADGREYVMVYVPEERLREPRRFRDPARELPPLRLTIPVSEYILEAERVQDPRRYYTFLGLPPVEPVRRLYTLDEVRYSARVRDIVRRIDLDTIEFALGSAAIEEREIPKLESLAEAMLELLERNPGETFLIEGHTDAVGPEHVNLALSDRRAESVAEALTDVYGVPPENLVTQGYGEQYLKVNTQAASRENRRVAVRRITPLVAPVASAQ